ncbi:hypothetical protein GCM10020331_040310 [Ectobacillus funiculus]
MVSEPVILFVFEAALPLYGQELTKEITPIEARIGFAVKTNKKVHFLGKRSAKGAEGTGSPP